MIFRRWALNLQINLLIFLTLGGVNCNDLYENLALTGTPTQKDDYGDGKGGPEKAIDGNTNGNYHNGFMAHTGSANAWWQITLNERSFVAYINIYNRLDCCQGRLNGALVTMDGVLLGTVSQQNNVQLYSFVVGDNGQVIKIEATAGQTLQLAEVEVYGKSALDRASAVNGGGFYVGDGLLVEARGNLDSRENRYVGFCPSSHPYAFRDDLCCSDNDEKECDKFHVLWIPCEYETCQDFDIEVKKIKLFDASITSRYIFGYHGPENAIDGDFRTVAVSDLTQSNLTIWLSQNHQELYVISKLIIYTEQYFWYLPKLMKVTLKSNNGDQSPCRSILTKDPYEKYISTCTIPFAANQIVVSSRTEEPIFINEIEVYGYSHDMEEHKIAELENEPGYRLGIKRIGGKLTAVSARWGAPT